MKKPRIETLRFGINALSRNRCKKCKDENSLHIHGVCIHCGTQLPIGREHFGLDWISTHRRASNAVGGRK